MSRSGYSVKVLFLFFLILIPSVGAQYGEDSASLGQFVDEFSDLANVSVAVEVVRNSTVNTMRLNFTVGTTTNENYSTYTKTGANSRLIVTDYNITTDPTFLRGTEEGYYYDKGAGAIGDFVYEFDFVVNDTEAGDADSRDMGAIFGATNWIGDFQVKPVGTYDYLLVDIRNEGANDNFYSIKLVAGQDGALIFQNVSSMVAVHDSVRYARLTRSAGDVLLQVYSDEARTALLYDLTYDGGGVDDAYRYLYGWFAIDASGDSGDWFSGSVANLVNASGVAGGYSSEGYFTTEDYLDQVNGSTLALMTIAQIPATGTITVEFSSDNSTWVNSTTLTDGLDCIDLRFLNWSSSAYLRYNFTTTDSASSPDLNRSRLISTIGTAGAGATVEAGGESFIVVGLMLGLLFGIGILLAVTKR